MLATLALAVDERWTRQDEMLATLLELVDKSNRNFEIANSKKGAPKPKPLRVPRPKGRKPRKSMSSPEDVRAFMARR